jgi:hypothetical protein
VKDDPADAYHVPIIPTEERIVQNPVEKIIEAPQNQIEERTIEVPEVAQIVDDASVQHQVQTTEEEKSKTITMTAQRRKPQLIACVPKNMEWIPKVDEIVEVPVTKQRHEPTIQVLLKLVEVLAIEYIYHHTHGPAHEQRYVSMISMSQKSVEAPQIEVGPEIVQVPVHKNPCCCVCCRCECKGIKLTKLPDTTEFAVTSPFAIHVHDLIIRS